jgi:hypothetical protein
VAVSRWCQTQLELLVVVELDTKISVLLMGERLQDTSMAALFREVTEYVDISLLVNVLERTVGSAMTSNVHYAVSGCAVLVLRMRTANSCITFPKMWMSQA